MTDLTSKNIKKNKRMKNIFFVFVFFMYLIPFIVINENGFDHFYHLIRRFSGLTGVVSLFIAILISSLVKHVRSLFGVSYLKIHHLFSITGVVLITFHPLIMVIDFGTTLILLPEFSSWTSFLYNGGRVAIYMIYLAVISVLLKKYIIKFWRIMHKLIYPAFVLGTIHGLLMGTDMENQLLFILYLLMIFVTIMIFIYKIYSKPHRSQIKP